MDKNKNESDKWWKKNFKEYNGGSDSTHYSIDYAGLKADSITVDDYASLDNSLVVFYGFSGLLANKYSLIKQSEQENVRNHLSSLIQAKISVSFKTGDEFYQIIGKYKDTIQFEKITFQDAMSIIRLGPLKEQEKFIDADEDAFDENCIEECLPGRHACGKK